MFKDKDGTLKEPTWKQIEPWALELGNSRLHHKVQGKDLFAREAQFHPSCRNSFNLKYANYLRDTARAANCDKKETDQERKTSVHSKHLLLCLILCKVYLLATSDGDVSILKFIVCELCSSNAYCYNI